MASLTSPDRTTNCKTGRRNSPLAPLQGSCRRPRLSLSLSSGLHWAMTRGSKPHIPRHDCRERLGLHTLYVASACGASMPNTRTRFFAVCAASVYLRYVRSGQVGTLHVATSYSALPILFSSCLTYDLCSIHAYLTHSCTDTGSYCDSPPSNNIKLPLLKTWILFAPSKPARSTMVDTAADDTDTVAGTIGEDGYS